MTSQNSWETQGETQHLFVPQFTYFYSQKSSLKRKSSLTIWWQGKSMGGDGLIFFFCQPTNCGCFTPHAKNTITQLKGIKPWFLKSSLNDVEAADLTSKDVFFAFVTKT